MIVSFSKVVRVSRTYGIDEYFPGYCYDLPEREAKIFLRKGLAHEPSEYDMISDIILRLSWSSSKRSRSLSEEVKEAKITYGLKLTLGEASEILEDLASIIPMRKEGDLYSVSLPDDHVVRAGEVSS